MQLVVIPDGWPRTLGECPPGFFVWTSPSGGKCLCFKSEYHNDGKIEAFNGAGEYFVGDPNEAVRMKLMVQPVTYVWEED